jgi:LmbE family N-acetylglucosaminyl deacetylase
MYDPRIILKPKNILVVVAHPDDIEFCVGGSVARWVQDGAEVSYLVLTDGSIGSQDRTAKAHVVAATRQDEQRRAAGSLGVKRVFFCDYQDGALDARNNVKRDIVRIIRKVRPDTVITFDPTMVYSLSRGVINHMDHRAAGQATLDAIFPLARDYHSFPELTDKEKLEPHKVTDVLLINYDSANYYVDITDFLEAKLVALTEHQSQFDDMDGIKTLVREQARDTAHVGQTGTDYAEGFIRLTMPA